VIQVLLRSHTLCNDADAQTPSLLKDTESFDRNSKLHRGASSGVGQDMIKARHARPDLTFSRILATTMSSAKVLEAFQKAKHRPIHASETLAEIDHHLNEAKRVWDSVDRLTLQRSLKVIYDTAYSSEAFCYRQGL